MEELIGDLMLSQFLTKKKLGLLVNTEERIIHESLKEKLLLLLRSVLCACHTSKPIEAAPFPPIIGTIICK